jgi:exopolyphosphatase/guanosine-5'-triphosphate,3'-diphosphate pyrophosphatase
VLCACIDIGSNTTRLLVAECADGRLTAELQQRAFTRIGRGLEPGADISQAKIDEVADVVAEQRALAEGAGARAVRAVATAAIRRAANRDAFVAGVSGRCGLPVAVLGGDEEARLAFVGATRTLGERLDGVVAVVDVGGGSSEIAVGTVDGGVTWSESFGVGSGQLADRHLAGDPPTAAQLAAVRADAHAAFAGARIAGPPERAIGVGGSAASLRRLIGAELNAGTVERALGVLAGAPSADVARRFDLDPERVRLLPAGILVLDAAARRLGRPLLIGRGGLREGVVLELARAMMTPEP